MQIKCELDFFVFVLKKVAVRYSTLSSHSLRSLQPLTWEATILVTQISVVLVHSVPIGLQGFHLALDSTLAGWLAQFCLSFSVPIYSDERRTHLI